MKMCFRVLEHEDLDLMLYRSECDISLEPSKAHTKYHGYEETDPHIMLVLGVLGRIASKAQELAHFHSGDEDGIYLAYSDFHPYLLVDSLCMKELNQWFVKQLDTGPYRLDFRDNSHPHLKGTTESIHAQSISIFLATKKARWTSGSLALVAGTVLWSSWFLVQSKIGKRYPLQYSSTAIMMFFGAIQSFTLSLSIERDLSSWILKGKLEIFCILYAGIVGSGLCFVGMSWCVKKRGPVFSAAFSPLVQMIAALFDIPLLHEPLHLGSVVGSAIVVAGLYFYRCTKTRRSLQKGDSS